jgi:ABC-type multidrug transport system fused ATPase/permease subunit
MLSYALKATQSLTFAIRASTALENMFTSVSRVKEYAEVEQEVKNEGEARLHEPFPAARDTLAAAPSPTTGSFAPVPVLIGQNVVARYAPGLPAALNGVSFSISCGQLIGICGRTGSGKSTLSLILSRAMELSTGSISLFGKNLSEISLAQYRREVLVYPQDSFIFSGTLRKYLNPSGCHSDLELNALLRELSTASGMGGNAGKGTGTGDSTADRHLNLELEIASGGQNLSAGEKQLVVLAKAALSSSSVIILDEITSSMDAEASRLSMVILKKHLCQGKSRAAKNLPPSAVVLISHRLEEIKVCDIVWVMGGGELLECGTTDTLIANKESHFSQMLSTFD